MLDEKIIRKKLEAGLSSLPIILYDITDSTNKRAAEFAAENPGVDAVFIADGQSQGSGRRGRSFHSEKGAGLYISLLLHPRESLADAVKLTAFAAVAARRAIFSLCGVKPGIKWVNDLYLGGKKLGGILTAGRAADRGKLEFAVVGIGINIRKITLPAEIRDIATSLEAETGKIPERSALASALINELYSGLDTLASPSVLSEYREADFLTGRRVTVQKLSGDYSATVKGISDNFELILELDEGKTELLSTGEVSIRLA